MLVVFYGTDWRKVNEAAKKRLEDFLAKHPSAETFSLSDDTFSEGELERHIGAAGLFAGAHAIVVSRLLQHEEYGKTILDRFDDLATSENLFIIKEDNLPAKTKKLIEKKADEFKEFVGIGKKEQKPFQIFALADALGMRDKKKLWIGYQQALREGMAPEEISTVLAWQAKTLLQVSAGATDGIKPFVLGKAKRFLKNYSDDEARALSFSFVSLYHDARRGAVDFGNGLERLILTL